MTPGVILIFHFFMTMVVAHMEMSWPYALRSKLDPANAGQSYIDYSMTSPLAADGSQFPCKGYLSGPGRHGVATLAAPGQYNVSLSGTAFHDGGSCQLSLSNNNGSTFHVFESYIGNCPTGPNSMLDYTMPAFVPPGEYVFAWTWLNHVGNREFYMNCALITITGSAMGPADASEFSALPGIWVANQQSINDCTTTEFVDPCFPDPGPTVIYGGDMQQGCAPSPASCEVPPPGAGYGPTAAARTFSPSISSTSADPTSSADPPASSSDPPASSDPPTSSSDPLSSTDPPASSSSAPPVTSSTGAECATASDMTLTFTFTSETTTTVCPACTPNTLVTVTVTTTASCTNEQSSSGALPTTGTSSSSSASGGGGSTTPPPTSSPPASSSTASASPGSSSIPYADPADLSPYEPCVPGTFLCTSPSVFWTCDSAAAGGWAWQYPRPVADGMACLPALEGSPPGSGQQPGSPPGQSRADLYVRARPDGACAVDGSYGCADGGASWLVCDNGGWVDMGPVEAGMVCVGGNIVPAS